jgi:hypothetical protein
MPSPMVHDPLTRLMCCPTSDGAAILCSEEFVYKYGAEPRHRDRRHGHGFTVVAQQHRRLRDPRITIRMSSRRLNSEAERRNNRNWTTSVTRVLVHCRLPMRRPGVDVEMMAAFLIPCRNHSSNHLPRPLAPHGDHRSDVHSNHLLRGRRCLQTVRRTLRSQ